jgi:hypothetical protein
MGIVEKLANLVTPSGLLQRRTLNKALTEAFRARDIPAMEALVAQGADVNCRIKRLASDGGRTPMLVEAADFGKIDMIRALLKMGADPNLADTLGYTALHRAVFAWSYGAESWKNSIDGLALLIESGADCNRPSPKGETPLHLAVRTMSVGPAVMLAPHTDLSIRDKDGKTPGEHVPHATYMPEVAPILRAVTTGDMSVVGGQELAAVLDHGGPRCLQYFLDRGFSVNMDDGAIVAHALERKDAPRLLQQLLDMGADTGSRTIDQLLLRGDSTLVEPFLKDGLDPGALAARADELIRRQPEVVALTEENAMRAAWLLSLARKADPSKIIGSLSIPRLSRRARNRAMSVKNLRSHLNVTPDKSGS